MPFARTIRSLDHDTGRSALLAWLAGCVFLGAWSTWFFLAKVTVYEVSDRARLEVERSAHPVAALIPGKITSLSMVLEQKVQAEEVLVILDAGSEKLRLEEEEARLKALPPQISALNNEIAAQERARREDHEAALSAIEAARARYKEAVAAADFAKDNERRQTELGNSGRIAAIEAIRARSEAQKMIAAVDAHLAEIRRQEREAQTRIHQNDAEIEERKRSLATLIGQLETTRATIARLRQDIEKHVIRSPVAGQVGDVAPLQVGAYVAEGEKLGSIVPTGKLRIVGEFKPAAVLGRIHPGQAARLRLDGFPWAQYGSIPATVNHVATEIRDGSVRVEFMPEASAPAGVMFQHGLPGMIEVDVERVAPALLIWRAAGQMLSHTIPRQSPSDVEPP